jgi:hypothetical protein
MGVWLRNEEGQTDSSWVGGQPKQAPLNLASRFETARLRHYSGLAHLEGRPL